MQKNHTGKKRDFPKKSMDRQGHSKTAHDEVVIDDDSDDDDDVVEESSNFNKRAPDWSKTNGKLGHNRHNEKVTMMNGGTSPDYVSRSHQESRNHHHPHHQQQQHHPHHPHLQHPSRPYNSHAKGSPLQASSAPLALDKGR